MFLSWVKETRNTQLELKGVVFNEMKGAMGSQAARFNRALGATLFPTSTYHHNSGGDPVSIPTLTHEDLTRFHATHYHPSNARVFTYGDLPLERTLAKSQELALGKFDRIDVSALDVADELLEQMPELFALAELEDDAGKTALHRAATVGNEPALKLLLKVRALPLPLTLTVALTLNPTHP